ncbi:uncharacterized protein BDV14DRAFT_205889 [Aspergillus stella-maris]|uniref:uncharacterized protein n=1 Tax=Aspergillus stella-maris TaxID=1810926 RepID=UPI003CCCEBC0
MRRGNMTLADMYTWSSSGLYYYLHGANLRAFAAFVAGFLLPLPGFIDSFGMGTSLNKAASHMYALGWELSFLVGGTTYLVLGLIWPVPGDERSMGFEQASTHCESLEQPLVLEASVGFNGLGCHGENEAEKVDKSARICSHTIPVSE